MSKFLALSILMFAFGSWAQTPTISLNYYLEEHQRRIEARLALNNSVPEYLFSTRNLIELTISRLARGELRATNSYTKTFLEHSLEALRAFNPEGFASRNFRFADIILRTTSQLEGDLNGAATPHLLSANQALASNLLEFTYMVNIGDRLEAVPLGKTTDFFPIALNFLDFIKRNQRGNHPDGFLCAIAQLENHIERPYQDNRSEECPPGARAPVDSRYMFHTVHGLLLSLSPKTEVR